MTVGIPDDMRRTAFVSLVGHLVLLAALTAVPVFKVSSPGPASYQVTLVAPALRPAPHLAPAAPAKHEPAPKPVERVPTPPVKTPAPAPPPAVKAPAPVPPPVAQVTVAPPAKAAPMARPMPSKAQERLTDSLKETLQKVTVPKEVTPAIPTQSVPRASKAAGAAPPVELPEPALKEFQRPVVSSESSTMKASSSAPVTKPVTQPPKSPSETNLNEMLRRADESLRKPPVVAKPAAPVPPPTTTPKMSEDIGKLLSALPPPAPVPPVTAPEGKTRPSKAEPPAPVAAAAGPSAASRAATVKRCPPKAERYCPILEAAINRAWNADTNPAVRQALESAGDSTVLVRIVIQPNGEIREIRINGSSGNEPYDRAVQSVLREIRALPPLPEEMKGEPFVAVTTFTYAKKQDS